MRHEIISLKDLKGLYLLRRRFKKWRQNEWKNHVVYTFTGRLTEFELKNTHWDFHGLKNTCSFTCKPTTKCIESCVYFTEFFGFRFLTRVLMGNYLPVWALQHCPMELYADISQTFTFHKNNIFSLILYLGMLGLRCMHLWLNLINRTIHIPHTQIEICMYKVNGECSLVVSHFLA